MFEAARTLNGSEEYLSLAKLPLSAFAGLQVAQREKTTRANGGCISRHEKTSVYFFASKESDQCAWREKKPRRDKLQGDSSLRNKDGRTGAAGRD